MQEIQVQSLDQEDPMEKGMAIHFRILDCTVPWTEEPVAAVHGVMESRQQLSD